MSGKLWVSIFSLLNRKSTQNSEDSPLSNLVVLETILCLFYDIDHTFTRYKCPFLFSLYSGVFNPLKIEHRVCFPKITYNESMADMTLRNQHPKLHYQSYSYTPVASGLELKFNFHLEPSFNFTTTTTLEGVTESQLSRIPQEVLNWYVFHIGLVESLSYWKLAIPSEIVLEAGFLSPSQEAWWHDLLIQGMGEFFYVNDIDFTPSDFVRFANAKKIDESNHNSIKSIQIDQTINRDINIQNNKKIMIPIGGGKDSIVSFEVLQQAGFNGSQMALLELHPTIAAKQVAELSRLPQIKLTRELDPQLLELNKQGYLNGHTPFSALLAFLTNLTALIWGYDYVAVSNERSSNEGNVMFHGQEINHQYSKTYLFETKFREYLSAYGPTQAPEYFSFMRPLYELQIAQLFTTMKPYHLIFRSCNVGRETNSWCGRCAKCLFAYFILAAVMPVDQVQAIFGQDLLANMELKRLALELLGYAEQKPLECVGTHEETKVAAWMTVEQYQKAGQSLPALLADLDQEYLKHETDKEIRQDEILLAWNGENHVPPDLETILQTALKAASHV